MSSVIVRKRLRGRREVRSGRGRVLLIGLLVIASMGGLALVAGLGTVFAVYQHYADDYVPIEEKLRLSEIGLTDIYDRYGPEDGTFLGSLPNQDAQLLDPVPLEEISEWMITATVSTEDNSFWDHPGVNLRGLVRAAYENYVESDFGEGTGGSSITQQVIKNIYICPQIGDVTERCDVAERDLDRKLREIAYAIELEQDYSKAEILGWYLNQISYAGQYIGVQAAAQGYFHKDASELDLPEAALLAGIPSSPTRYHPRLNCIREQDNPEQCVIDGIGRTLVGGDAKQRQEDVLDLMVEHGHITPAQAAEAKAFDLRVFAATNPIKAAAFIDNQVEPRLVRMCEAGILPKLEFAETCAQSVHSAGYQVITSLDWSANQQAQELAQARIAAGLEAECNCYNASIVTIDPNTGQIIVYVPNVDPSKEGDPYVRGEWDQATEVNQPGSSFKPAVYLTWFDLLNKAPMSTFWDTNPLKIGEATITNPRGAPGTDGLISARSALGGSQNVAAVRAAYEAGPDNVIEMAKKLGITTLHQGFDPSFYSHSAVTYGPSIATGGANIRVVDMAYMNSVFANMGVMVGVPTLAQYVDPATLKDTAESEGADYELALQQAVAFQRGHIRLPGTRELDPVVVLEVRDADGTVLFKQGEPERREVVNPGSVWLLHSIMSDCTARSIIWGCGTSNDDYRLDTFVNGVRIPGGVKTGTQQGFLRAEDTLETWTNGYSRHAATAVWVGNANNELVHDGPGWDYAAANTTVWLYKQWMGQYHGILQARGLIGEPLPFTDLQPSNVAQVSFQSPTTSQGLGGGCSQMVTSWVRSDVTYESECTSAEIDTRNGLLAGPETPAQFRATRKFVKLPELGAAEARQLAARFNIPIVPTRVSDGAPAISISSPSNGATVTGKVDVVGSAVGDWSLSIAKSSGSGTTIGSGSSAVTNGVLGSFDTKDLEDGIYTITLSASDANVGNLSISVQVNVKKAGGGNDDDDDDDNGGGNGNDTPTPGGGGGTPVPTVHPLGFDECGGDPNCGGDPVFIGRCGPNGWFIDRPNVGTDYSDRGWQTFIVNNPQDAPLRASQLC